MNSSSFLGGGLEYFLFSPLPGDMIQFDEHIFEMGWNYQPEILIICIEMALPLEDHYVFLLFHPVVYQHGRQLAKGFSRFVFSKATMAEIGPVGM